MVSVPEYEAQLSQRAATIAQAEQQVKQFNPLISQSQQQLRAATPLSQVRVQEQQRQRTESKQQTLQDIQTAKQQQALAEQEFAPVKGQYQEYLKAQEQFDAYNAAIKDYMQLVPPTQIRNAIERTYLEALYRAEKIPEPKEVVTITDIPAQKLPPINIRETDQPGEAVARAIRQAEPQEIVTLREVPAQRLKVPYTVNARHPEVVSLKPLPGTEITSGPLYNVRGELTQRGVQEVFKGKMISMDVPQVDTTIYGTNIQSGSFILPEESRRQVQEFNELAMPLRLIGPTTYETLQTAKLNKLTSDLNRKVEEATLALQKNPPTTEGEANKQTASLKAFAFGEQARAQSELAAFTGELNQIAQSRYERALYAQMPKTSVSPFFKIKSTPDLVKTLLPIPFLVPAVEKGIQEFNALGNKVNKAFEQKGKQPSWQDKFNNITTAQPKRELPFYGKAAQQPVSYLAKGISAIIPDKIEKELNIELAPSESFILGAEGVANQVVLFSSLTPFMSNTQVTLNEPLSIRAKPLAPKQQPRIYGQDISFPEKNTIVFKEKIIEPARYQYLTSPSRQYFGLEPTKTIYTPRREFIQQSFASIKVTPEGKIIEPAFTKLQQINPAKSYFYVSKLRGGAELIEFPLKAKDVTQQRQINKLFSSVGQGAGFQTINENQNMFGFGIESEKFIRVSKYDNPILYKPGSRITSAEGIGIQNKLLSSNEGTVYSYSFVTRNINRPFSVAKDFPVTKGYSFVPAPTEEIDITFIPKSVGPTTKAIYPSITKEVLASAIGNIGKSSLPKAVASIPKSLIISESKNIFALTSATATSLKAVQTESARQRDIPKPLVTEQPRLNTSEDIILTPRTEQVPIVVITPRAEVTPKDGQVAGPKIVELPKVDVAPRMEVVPREIVSEVIVPRVVTPSVPLSPGPIAPPPFSPPYPTIYSTDDILKRKSKKPIRKVLSDIAFIPEVRRRGKYVPIGPATTKNRALLAGAKVARGTLAASFRARPVKLAKPSSMMDIPYSPSSRIFRAPKGRKELPFTFVQRREQRLASRTEVSEIVSSRGKKRSPFFK